ncbi:hypothetical protein HDE_04455 [Halotydeus destructor]|nr:hypothetical protein HDE_04455 [Halotydeus destructor]
MHAALFVFTMEGIKDNIREVLWLQSKMDGRVAAISEPGSDKFMRLVVDTQLTKFVQCVSCKMTIALPKQTKVDSLHTHSCPPSDAMRDDIAVNGYRVDWIHGETGANLMVNGHIFYTKSKNSEIQSWRCSKYEDKGCLSTCFTKCGWLIMPVVNRHSHALEDMRPRNKHNQAFIVPKTTLRLDDEADMENMESSGTTESADNINDDHDMMSSYTAISLGDAQTEKEQFFVNNHAKWTAKFPKYGGRGRKPHVPNPVIELTPHSELATTFERERMVELDRVFGRPPLRYKRFNYKYLNDDDVFTYLCVACRTEYSDQTNLNNHAKKFHSRKLYNMCKSFFTSIP